VQMRAGASLLDLIAARGRRQHGSPLLPHRTVRP
jgi:hypothetical protein